MRIYITLMMVIIPAYQSSALQPPEARLVIAQSFAALLVVRMSELRLVASLAVVNLRRILTPISDEGPV